MREKIMIYDRDEEGIFENSIKVCCKNYLFSLFLKILEDAVQRDETYMKALLLLENMSVDISNLKKRIAWNSSGG